MPFFLTKWIKKGAEKAIAQKLDCVTELHIKDLDVSLKGPAIEFHIDVTGAITKQDLLDLLNSEEDA